jgi:hypothetical protein
MMEWTMKVEKIGWTENGWGFEQTSVQPDLVLYFGSARQIEATSAPSVLSERFPGALLLGCSTSGGIVGNEIDDQGIVGVTCSFRDTTVRLVEADVADSAGSENGGRALGDALRGENLAGVFVLSDGVQVDGTKLAAGIQREIGTMPISGGLAGDGARFERTLVGCGRTARTGRVAAIGFYGNAVRLAHASGAGWEPFGPKRRITRSHGNTIAELDGKPALQLYERYLGEDAANLPGSGLLFPLLVWDTDVPQLTYVRTVLGIDRAAGTISFGGDVPEGWAAQLMRGSLDGLIDGSIGAVERLLQSSEAIPQSETLAMMVSCIGRNLVLGQRTEEEVRPASEAFGSGVTGFYAHGVIVPDAATHTATLQNQTMSLTLIHEATG